MYSARFLRNLNLRTVNHRKDIAYVCSNLNHLCRSIFTQWTEQFQKYRNSMDEYKEVPARANPLVKQLKTDAFKSIFTSDLTTLIDLFKKYKYEIRLAGGAVRDILMSIEPKDLDFATTATPEQMKQMFDTEQIRMINMKGEKHGTITARINNQNFEITTLRIDTLTNGRHAEVEFTTNWRLDANRRDLTINSMFLDFEGNLYDYFHGCEDLEQRRIVFVGNPALRIQEDYLRILRYFRFYGRIATEPDKHDEHTIKIIKEYGGGLERISGERIWSELQRIISGNFAVELIELMLKCNLGEYCGLPEQPNISEMRKVCQAMKSFDGNFPPIHLMTALLHSKEDVTRLHERLKLSAYERDLAYFITGYRDKVDTEYKTLRDYQKMCLLGAHLVKRDHVEEMLKYKGKQELHKELVNWQRPILPIKGNALKEIGYPNDRRLGEVLQRLNLIWADSNFTLSEKELLEHLPKVREELKIDLSAVKNKKMKLS